ncbi:MAG: RidA family protein [Balneolaceae bacterium]
MMTNRETKRDGQQSRRAMLKTLFTGVATAGAGLFGVARAADSNTSSLNKGVGEIEFSDAGQPLISQFTTHENFVFVKGMGDHDERDIRVATKNVLDTIERQLEQAGTSMDHALKVTVFLRNLRDYEGMNEAYRGRFGDHPPARSTVACYGGIPGGSLLEIDCIAAK